MLSFIYQNQSIIIILAVVIASYLFYLAVKKMPTKVIKKKTQEDVKDKKDPASKVVDPEKKSEEKNILKPETSEEKTQSDDEKGKKIDKKPKIVQIYKRSERKDESNANSKQDNDPIYNRNVEFVNTSKNIAKFKSFAEDKKEENQEEQNKKDEFGFVADEQENCDFCEDKVKHFDHSKRLSSIMKDGEDLFNSHISDKYMNMNSERHINLSKLEQSLMRRTEIMMKNSETKVNCDCEHEDCNNGECETCEEILEDDVKVDMKTALIADTYFKRKSRR